MTALFTIFYDEFDNSIVDIDTHITAAGGLITENTTSLIVQNIGGGTELHWWPGHTSYNTAIGRVALQGLNGVGDATKATKVDTRLLAQAGLTGGAAENRAGMVIYTGDLTDNWHDFVNAAGAGATSYNSNSWISSLSLGGNNTPTIGAAPPGTRIQAYFVPAAHIGPFTFDDHGGFTLSPGEGVTWITPPASSAFMLTSGSWTAHTGANYKWPLPFVPVYAGLFLSDQQLGDGIQYFGHLIVAQEAYDAKTIKTPIGSATVDNVRFDDAPTGLELINTVPEAGETRVRVSAALDLWLAEMPSTAIDTASVIAKITAGVGSPVTMYDGSAGGFQTGYTGTATFQASPSSGVNDELILKIIPATDLLGDTPYKIEIDATAGGDTLDEEYTWTTESTLAPAIDEMLWLDPRRVRARFRESMQQDAQVNGTLYFQKLSGAIEFIAPNKIQVSNLLPSMDWIGYWSGFSGSAYPQNNRYLEIIAVDLSARTMTLDTVGIDLKADDSIDKDADGNVVRRRSLRATISSYRLESRAFDELPTIVCSYAPVVASLRAPTVDERPADIDPTRYVIITWHDDVSISRMYRIHAARALNDIVLAADSTSIFDFTTPSFGSPPGRIDLWSTFPEAIRDEDLRHQGQLRRMSVVLQDLLNVMWHRCDTIPTLTDPDNAPLQWIDYLLYTMGNPFRLPMTEPQKRRLISILVEIYKQIGTCKVIEDTLAFFTGITFTCAPFIDSGAWVLGTNTLGVDTILGPGTAFERNAYEIVSPEALTDEQRRQVTDIAEFLDPVYMHLIRIVEP